MTAMSDTCFNEEQRAMQRSVRELARDKSAPRAAEIDQSGEFPHDIVALYLPHDLFALPFPEQYGGLSGSALTLNVAVEAIAAACATSALILTVQSLGGYPIMIEGTDD